MLPKDRVGRCYICGLIGWYGFIRFNASSEAEGIARIAEMAGVPPLRRFNPFRRDAEVPAGGADPRAATPDRETQGAPLRRSDPFRRGAEVPDTPIDPTPGGGPPGVPGGGAGAPHTHPVVTTGSP